MSELEYLIEQANHGLKALEILATKYRDRVEWRCNGGEWMKITEEVEQLEFIEFRQVFPGK